VIPSANDVATVAERMEAGRGLRSLVPRSSHAAFTPSDSRPDPIDILQEQAKDRLAAQEPTRA
jgi:hypothetical protein